MKNTTESSNKLENECLNSREISFEAKLRRPSNITENMKKSSTRTTEFISKNNSDSETVCNGNSKATMISECDDENGMQQTIVNKQADKKNAFQIMMRSRNKIIGSNSPGKDLKLDNLCKDDKVTSLSARKKLLSDWADFKGGAKRKKEEEERDEIIKIKLEERSKRMKKLLNTVDLNTSKDLVCKKGTAKKPRKRILRRSSSSSQESDSLEDKKDGFFDS